MSQTVSTNHLSGIFDFTRHEPLDIVSDVPEDKRDRYALPKDITLGGKVDLDRSRGFRYHLRTSATTETGTRNDNLSWIDTL